MKKLARSLASSSGTGGTSIKSFVRTHFWQCPERQQGPLIAQYSNLPFHDLFEIVCHEQKSEGPVSIWLSPVSLNVRLVLQVSDFCSNVFEIFKLGTTGETTVSLVPRSEW